MALPGLATTSTGVGESVALVDTTGLLASGGESTSLTVLVDGVNDPVDAGITANDLVGRIDENDLKVLVSRVLVDPVRVQDTEIGAAAANTLLSSGTELSLVLELVNTLVGGLAVSSTLAHRTLAATSSNTDSVDNETLLGLVTQLAGSLRTTGAAGTVDDVELAVLPGSNSVKEAQDVAGLLAVDLLEVLVGSHCLMK